MVHTGYRATTRSTPTHHLSAIARWYSFYLVERKCTARGLGIAADKWSAIMPNFLDDALQEGHIRRVPYSDALSNLKTHFDLRIYALRVRRFALRFGFAWRNVLWLVEHWKSFVCSDAGPAGGGCGPRAEKQ